MTKERFEREKKYRVSLAIAKNLLNKEIITKSDYRKIDTMLTKKYNPLLGNVWDFKSLILWGLYGNM